MRHQFSVWCFISFIKCIPKYSMYFDTTGNAIFKLYFLKKFLLAHKYNFYILTLYPATLINVINSSSIFYSLESSM